MGPRNELWATNALTADGMMLARFQRNLPLYHGTEDASAFNPGKIRPGSYYTTHPGYAKFHVTGRSYFTDGVMESHFLTTAKRKAFANPQVLEYATYTTDRELPATNYVYGNYALLETWVTTLCGSSMERCQKLRECVDSGKKGHICKSDYFGSVRPRFIDGAIMHRFVLASDLVLPLRAALTLQSSASAEKLCPLEDSDTLANATFPSDTERERYKKTLDLLSQVAKNRQGNKQLLHDEVVMYATPRFTERTMEVTDPFVTPTVLFDLVETLIDAAPLPFEVPLFALDYLTFVPMLSMNMGSPAVREEYKATKLRRAKWPLEKYKVLLKWNEQLLARLEEYFSDTRRSQAVEQLTRLGEPVHFIYLFIYLFCELMTLMFCCAARESHTRPLSWSEVGSIRRAALELLKGLCECNFISANVFSSRTVSCAKITALPTI